MKPKGIKTIALLLAAVILVIGSVAGMAAADVGDSGGDEEFEWNWDACYWWEALPISPHHQQQAREVGILILDRYFGIYISAMSPQELEELWDMIGHQNQEKAERLFAHYAREKGFQIPGMPAPREEEEFIPPPDATYWWEFVDPEFRDEAIRRAKAEFPEVDVMTLTLEKYDHLINPPPPPLRLLTIQERKQYRGTITAFGTPRTYTAEAEIRDWFDRLLEAITFPPPFTAYLSYAYSVRSLGLCWTGFIRVDLCANKVTEEQLLALGPKIYAVIAESAERLGIGDVPVAFHRTVLRLLGPAVAEVRLHQVALFEGKTQSVCIRSASPATEFACPPSPPTRTDIVGGVGLQTEHHGILFRLVRDGATVGWRIGDMVLGSTTGFAVRDPIFWWDDIDYTMTGHDGPPNRVDICADAYPDVIRIIHVERTRTQVNHPVFQPEVAPGNEAGTVAGVVSYAYYADMARVAIADQYVTPPYVRVLGFNEPVRGWADPRVHQQVWKTGVTTDTTHGWVIQQLPSVSHPVFGTLRNQFRANLWSDHGDSGGPVFRRLLLGGVEVVGVVWGGVECPTYGLVYTYFSPISGIKLELPGWYPYTK
ncbi:S1 family peptidase [Dehalococcoidia bacterium]|nr:S1 family peptidase [Dehalococcoidia bacterium]